MNRFNPCFQKGCPAPGPLPAGGFLMQQIIGSGRTLLRYQRFTLCVSALCASDPCALRLTQVCADEENIRYERCDSPCGIELTAHIPLTLTLSDGCGCAYTASSSITVPVHMRLCANERDLCRGRFLIAASVRLARCGACVRDNAVDACLDVCVEAWSVVSRPLCASACPPACPAPLPLYPQPYPLPLRD